MASESRSPQPIPQPQAAPEARGAGSRFQQTFAALKYRNYRLWFTGQLVSLFGSWMQITAQGFLIYQLTNSAAYLGYVGFAAGVPAWLFTLYGGLIADRFPRRRLLLITQISMMVLALVLAALVFTGVVQPWHIIVLAFLLGIANAFEGPARLAFVRELVDREDMTNAIALNATMFNAATATGPAIAGVAYALVGPAWCFLLNGLSFIAVIAALVMMELAPQGKPERQGSAWAEIGIGLRYIAKNPTISILLGVVGVTSMFGISSATLFPAWAVDILGGDATTNGLLQSARGFGALLGALLIASLGRFTYKGRLMTAGSFAFPAFLLIFALVHWLPLSLIVLVGTGLAVIMVMNIANALVQSLVPDSLRGRVMSVYSLTFFGSMPFGALWIGAVAENFSPPAALMVGAAVSLIFAALMYIFAPRIRALE